MTICEEANEHDAGPDGGDGPGGELRDVHERVVETPPPLCGDDAGNDAEGIDDGNADEIEHEGDGQRLGDEIDDGAMLLHAFTEAGPFEAEVAEGSVGVGFVADGGNEIEPFDILDCFGSV